MNRMPTTGPVIPETLPDDGVPGAQWHLDVQHMLVAERTPPVISEESLNVAWLDVADLPEDTAPGVD